MEKIKKTFDKYYEGTMDMKDIDDIMITLKYDSEVNTSKETVSVFKIFEQRLILDQENVAKKTIKLRDETFYKSKMPSFDL